VGLRIPEQHFTQNLLAPEHNPNRKLAEGDPPIVIQVPQDDMLKRHAAHWRGIIAIAIDSTGREYISPSVTEAPSWVTNEQPYWVKTSLKK
jgi:hypothetical protein